MPTDGTRKTKSPRKLGAGQGAILPLSGKRYSKIIWVWKPRFLLLISSKSITEFGTLRVLLESED